MHTPQSAVSTTGLSEMSAGSEQQLNEVQPLQEEEEGREEEEGGEGEEKEEEDGEELVFQAEESVQVCACVHEYVGNLLYVPVK